MNTAFTKITTGICTAVTMCTLTTSNAYAGWGTVTVTDGNGNGVQSKHQLLGQKSLIMQDQLGDEVVHKKGLFGINRETGVSVLGNETKVKHGLLHGTSVEGKDMFGDSWKSKKTFMGLGPRITTVNAKGVSDMLDGFMQHAGMGNQMLPGQVMPGQMAPERGGPVVPSNFSQYAPARGFGEAQAPVNDPNYMPNNLPNGTP